MATYTRESPGVSAFALEEGVVYYTYSAYARGLDPLWGMYPLLDRTPKERNEAGASGGAATTVRQALSGSVSGIDGYAREYVCIPAHAFTKALAR